MILFVGSEGIGLVLELNQKLSECVEQLSLSLKVGTGISSREISLIR